MDREHVAPPDNGGITAGHVREASPGSTFVPASQWLRAEQVLNELVERCPFGICIVDSSFKIFKVNRRSQDAAFAMMCPVVGQPFDEAARVLWSEEVAREICAAFRRTLDTAEPYYSKDFVHRRADSGQVESYEWELHRLTLPDGTQGVVCFYQNSTALRRATELAEAELSAQTLMHEVSTVCARPGAPTEECLECVLDAAIAISSADKGNIRLKNAAGDAFEIAIQRGFERPFLDFFASVRAGEAAACGAAALAATRVIVEDVAGSDVFADEVARQVLLDAGVRAVQSTPLIASDGTVLGILSTHYGQPQRPDTNVLRRLDALALQTAEYLRRARIDEALRKSESRYRDVVESQSELVCRFRADGRILFANEAYAVAVGTTAAKLEGQSFWSYVSDVDRPKVEAVLASLSPSRPEIRIENRFETTEGPRWTLWLNRALAFDAAGRCVEAQSTGIDITDRKRAEARLQANRDALYGLVKNSPFGVYLIDADFRMAEISAGAAATFAGVDPLLGRDFAEVLRAIWSEPFASQAIGIFRRTLETGEPYISDDFTERRADRGSEEAYDWRTERVMMPDGRFGVVCYFYELTAQRRLEHELRLANERSEAAVVALRESDRRKDEFLATLSHELRNPLAPMRYALELLERADENQSALVASGARTMMRRQMSHLVRLMDDLLDVSRISRGKINLRRERIELTGLIAHAAEPARLLGEGAEQHVVLDLPNEAIHVDADPVRLAQVVGNLLNNACRYSDRGARIVCSVWCEAGDAVIQVQDNGVGIPPDRLGEVFDLFSQIEGTLERSRGGLGIGLHLVKQLVEMHGGTVAARSAGLGQGSEFVVRLPLAAAPAVVDVADPAAQPERGAGVRRVLIVDDNVDAANSLSMLLQLAARETEVAHDGEEAVRKAADYRPDAILLDIGMPKMNGYDVCRAIRATPAGRSVLIVALSGYGTDDDRRKSTEAGFDSHLVKPVDLDTLEQVLSQVG